MTQEGPLPPTPLTGLRKGSASLALLRLAVYLVLALAVAMAASAGYQTMVAKAALNPAVALLMLNAGLGPNVDYLINFSLKQKIDDSFDPRFNSAAAEKQKKAEAVPTTTPTAS